MSAIDSYKHELLGMVKCPSPFELVYGRGAGEKQEIPLYRLLEDIPSDETDFQGKKGDLLLGGGSGEIDALRISMPETFLF